MPHSEEAETLVLASFQGPFGYYLAFISTPIALLDIYYNIVLDILYIDKYSEL